MTNNNWQEEFDNLFPEINIAPERVILATPEQVKTFINDLLTTRTKQIIGTTAKTPKNWNEWSIERQLGYNRAILNFKQQLTSQFLPQESEEKE